MNKSIFLRVSYPAARAMRLWSGISGFSNFLRGINMEKFWNIFWKSFGAAVLLAVVIGIIAGMVSHSQAIAYDVVQKTIALSLGICGSIGFGVVPVVMYFEDRARGGESVDAAE
jgi:cation transporter-like permease